MYILGMRASITELFSPPSPAPAANEGFYAGDAPPFEEYAIPDYARNFTDDLILRCGKKGIAVEQGLLFGGNVRDQMRRIPSKDTDLYFCVPELVEIAESLIRQKAKLEDIGRAVSSYLPTFMPNMESMKFSVDPDSMQGKSFALTGLYWRAEVPVLDVAIGSKKLDQVEFSKKMGAPIMSFVATVHGDGPAFVYHKDLVADTGAKILRARDPNDAFLKEKAAAKGWSYVSGHAPQQPKGALEMS